MEETTKKKKQKQLKVWMAVLFAALFIGLMFFLFAGDNRAVLKALFQEDVTKDEARDALSRLGVRGYITVGILSMLQVMFTFLPAEPVQVIAGAAVFSILMAFVGPLSAFISTIPGDVIGGITFLLYGMIGTSGLRILVDKQVDYSKNKNLITTSVVFVAGLSGLTVNFGTVSLSGMTLAAMTAVVISLIFHLLDKANLMND